MSLIRTYGSVTAKHPNHGPCCIGYEKSTSNQEGQSGGGDEIKASAVGLVGQERKNVKFENEHADGDGNESELHQPHGLIERRPYP